jgi:hypothetical protein
VKQTYTYTQFAFAIGTQDRLTLEASLPFHEEYVANEDKAFRARMRKDWIVSYISGNLGISQSKAIKIAEMTRTERNATNTKWEDSVNAGSKKFTYHVSRPESTTSNQGDLVAQALALYAKMSGAQKRSFKAKLPK